MRSTDTRQFHFIITTRRDAGTIPIHVMQEIDAALSGRLDGYERVTFHASGEVETCRSSVPCFELDPHKLEDIIEGKADADTRVGRALQAGGAYISDTTGRHYYPTRAMANKARIKLANDQANALRDQWQHLTVTAMTWANETGGKA